MPKGLSLYSKREKNSQGIEWERFQILKKPPLF